MGADTYFHTYPALEVDASNNVAITYTRSGTSEYAGAYYTSKPSDVTSLTGSKLLKAGNGYYYKTFGGSRNRWGDYNGAWLDPANTNRIYLLTEFVASTNTWGSWIGELTFSTTAAYTLVTAPNGGENWQIASTKNVTWNSSNVANVKIEYSTNNGTAWLPVVQSIPASSGSYAWVIPNTPSTQCLVRISDAANSSIIDVSNAPFTISASGQVLNWAAVTSGTTGDIWGIDIVDDNVIWISAANGDVRRSTDGGNTWLSAGNPGNGAYAVAGIDANTAVVATGPTSGNGSIFRTTNGGTSWTNVYTATGAWFNFVDNFDANTLWAQSDPTDGSFHIVKSTNGGATWALTSNRPVAPASTVYGANSSFYRIGNTCWFGTGGASGSTLANRVYKSTNGADGPWTFASTAQQFTGSLAFSTATGAGLVGYWQATNTLGKSTDGGATFTAQATTIGLVKGLEYVRNTPITYAAGDNGLFVSLDNGATWTADLTPTGTASMLSVRFNESGTVGFAGGAGGVLLKNIVPPVVPVEFTAFNASVANGKVMLDWSTATESNNQGFEVQRKLVESEDAQFTTIAFKPGAGTTTHAQNYNFTDDLSDFQATSVAYRLKQIDFDGRYAYSQEILIDNIAPDKFELAQNYPNPFNPITSINYQLPVSGNVTLTVYDALGKQVATLVNEFKNGGRYSVEFDGSKLSSGIYFYELRSGNFASVKKLVLMK
ncbi:MAG: T9SS type A sorting domain-containing protein [Ignavibacteriaceae bacterium]|nr:T9SS type A sorting domain-containing protein [Ignavibacteriaceae bacterium]